VSVRNRFPFCAIFAIAATIMMAARAKAQDAEPTAYANAPVGLNFFLAGYIFTEGEMAFDPSLAIANAQFHSHMERAFLGFSLSTSVILARSTDVIWSSDFQRSSFRASDKP
jgi:hypothetical protein